MQFNEKLKELRTKKGVSQKELADAIYVSRSAIAKWENGLGLPSNDSFNMLAEYFGVSPDELRSDRPTDSEIVKKNIVISKSRKILISITAVGLAAIIALIVCLVVLVPERRDNYYNGHRVLIAIHAHLYDGEDHLGYNEWDDGYQNKKLDPLTVQIGKQYTVQVEDIGEYIEGNPKPGWAGGATYYFDLSKIEFEYDKDVMEIKTVTEKNEQYSFDEIKFCLTVKKPCKCSALVVKYFNLRDVIILSANAAEDSGE